MATWTSDTITTMRRRWLVPTGTHGATAADLHAALGAAMRGYRSEHKLTDSAPIPDDALRITADDDHLIIQFAVELDD